MDVGFRMAGVPPQNGGLCSPDASRKEGTVLDRSPQGVKYAGYAKGPSGRDPTQADGVNKRVQVI